MRSLYLGRTSEEEKGWKMRPTRPRFCKVVVVIGVAVAMGVGDGDAEADGSGVVCCAQSSAAVAITMEKMMARRIIDGLNTKR